MMRRKLAVEKFNKCIDFYLSHINTESFKLYCEKERQEGEENHRKYVEEEARTLKDRTDFFADSMIGNISFGDVLSNDGVAKLLRKLHSLPKKLFKVENYYKKPSFINQYDYIQLQYSHSSTGIFAKIKLLKDKYIDSIDICWSQINNYYAYFEYDFQFKKCLTDELLHEFISNNLKIFTKKDFLFWYNVGDHLDMNYHWLRHFEWDLFPIICQHYITTYFYSEQGKYNKLLSLVSLVRKAEFDMDKYCMGLFEEAFYNKERKYAIIRSDRHEDSYLLLSGENLIPNFGITGYISRYGNHFYYKFFGYRELKLFEAEFSQFANGRKKITYNKQLKSLLNRMQSLTDGRTKSFENIDEEFAKNWDYYYSNEKQEFKEFNVNYLSKLRNVYSKNFEYLKILTELNYTKGNKWISIAATVISVIATIISLIGIFCK